MRSCTFFGHKNAPSEIIPTLTDVIIDLIVNKKVTHFYVGNQGNFDYYVRKILSELKNKYQHIDYAVVLAYFPVKSPFVEEKNYPTIFPKGMEEAHPQYAIVKRNMWMIENADFVITYVRKDYSGASRFKKIAEKKGLTLIEI